MKKIVSTLAGCVLLISTVSNAQRQPDKVIPTAQNIDNILLSPLTGEIILKQKDAIVALNPESLQQDWSVTKDQMSKLSAVDKAANVLTALNNPDLGKLFTSSDQINFIPNSPYIKAIIDDKDVILNSTDGKILFNSGAKDYRVLQCENLAEENKMLFIATDGKKFSCILYDLETGNEAWTTELTSVDNFMKQFGSIFSKGKRGAQNKLITAPQDIYTTINARLYKLDKAGGKIAWTTDFDLTDFYLSQNGQNIIVIKNAGSILSGKQAMNVINTGNGAPIWKDDIKGKYISYIEDWSDRILVAYSDGFNFYSYKDGSQIWKKDAKGDNIKKVIPIDNDYLYIADKDMNLIGSDGVSKWKKTIEICDKADDPVYYLGKVDNNRVFYLTSTLGNMVDYSSGKKIWKKNIEFDNDKPLLYAFDENSKAFMVYNDKKIYKFDPNAQDKPEPIAKLKEIKEDKTMQDIQLFDWGVCLVGQSDVIGVGFDGQTKYHNTYDEPGGGTRKFLKIAGGTVGAVAGTAGSMYSGVANATVTVQYRDASGKLVEQTGDAFDPNTKRRLSEKGNALSNVSANINATLMSRVKNRFNALKHNDEYAFVLTKGKGDETTQIVKVKKSDGTEVDKIAIDNNKPLYEIDPVTNTIYYAYKNELRIFSKQ
jgi:hypothetical protein